MMYQQESSIARRHALIGVLLKLVSLAMVMASLTVQQEHACTLA